MDLEDTAGGTTNPSEALLLPNRYRVTEAFQICPRDMARPDLAVHSLVTTSFLGVAIKSVKRLETHPLAWQDLARVRLIQ